MTDDVPSIRGLSVRDPNLADRVVDIQRSAYAVEAQLIGYDDIPPLHEDVAQVRDRTDLEWLGAFLGKKLIGIVAWSVDGGVLDIDRLAVDPAHARQGIGRRLVLAVPPAPIMVVSTGAANHPARELYESLGFVRVSETALDQGLAIVRYEKRSESRLGG